MKKILLLFLWLPGSITASPLVALEKAKQDLIGGKQKITQGKRDVMQGYFTIQDVTNKLSNAAAGLQPTVCMLTTVDKYAGDMVDAMGALIASILIVPPIGSAAAIGLALMIGIPDVITAIKNILNSVVSTLTTSKATIDTGNELMNPSIIGFVLHMEGKVSQANDLLNNNTDKLSPDFVTQVSQALAALNKFITLVKTKTDQMSGQFTSDQDRLDCSNLITGGSLSSDYFSYGLPVELSKNMLGCPNMGTKAALKSIADNAPKAKQGDDGKDNHPWADTRGGVVVPILNLLAQMRADIWRQAMQPAGDTSLKPKALPKMYQQFTLAEQKFDLAIAKLDSIITGFKAALEAAEDDGS